MRLQKLLGRGRELLINWEAPMASTFISSFSAQGVQEGGEVGSGSDEIIPLLASAGLAARNLSIEYKLTCF